MKIWKAGKGTWEESYMQQFTQSIPYLPRSTDVKNSGTGTPRRGEAMLSSQLGDIGKRRREIMARRRLGWSPASCEEEGRGRQWITTG